MVRFEVHPHQRSDEDALAVEAEVVDERWVKNSGGHRELRPVIETPVRIGTDEWPIELTLTRRDEMGFRMLLGRQALRGRAAVDPGRSYRAGRRRGPKRRARSEDKPKRRPADEPSARSAGKPPVRSASKPSARDSTSDPAHASEDEA